MKNIKNSNYIRTDLAMEAELPEPENEGDYGHGITCSERDEGGVKITVLKIAGEEGERILKKSRGTYVTIETGKLWLRDDDFFSKAAGILSEEIRKMASELAPGYDSALIAGLGVRGDNGLLINEKYGSYIFIGDTVTDISPEVLGAVTPVTPGECLHCGACRRACPSGALQNGCVDLTRCLSDLTQSKQPLTPEQEDALRRHPLVWGCDRCSEVCPLNRGVPETSNPAFREMRMTALTLADVDGLTRREFLSRYPDRAFTWRGPKPLIRNLKLHGE